MRLEQAAASLCLSESTNVSAIPGRSTEGKEVFPISEGKFQRRTLQLLVEIRRDISDFMQSRSDQNPAAGTSELWISRAETVEELMDMNDKLKTPEHRIAMRASRSPSK